jgi:hypothetical protein
LTFSCWISGQINIECVLHILQIADLRDNCGVLKRNFLTRPNPLER